MKSTAGFQTVHVTGPCNKLTVILTVFFLCDIWYSLLLAVSQINAQWTIFWYILQEVCAGQHYVFSFAQAKIVSPSSSHRPQLKPLHMNTSLYFFGCGYRLPSSVTVMNSHSPTCQPSLSLGTGYTVVGMKRASLKLGVVAEQLRAPNSSSADSLQQCVGSSPGHDTCVPEQDTLL